MSFFKTTLITAAFSLAVAGAASAQNVRGDNHRGQEGDQYDLYTAPPAPPATYAQPGGTNIDWSRYLYMSTKPPVRTDDPLFDRAKGWVGEAN